MRLWKLPGQVSVRASERAGELKQAAVGAFGPSKGTSRTTGQTVVLSARPSPAAVAGSVRPRWQNTTFHSRAPAIEYTGDSCPRPLLVSGSAVVQACITGYHRLVRSR